MRRRQVVLEDVADGLVGGAAARLVIDGPCAYGFEVFGFAFGVLEDFTVELEDCDYAWFAEQLFKMGLILFRNLYNVSLILSTG